MRCEGIAREKDGADSNEGGTVWFYAGSRMHVGNSSCIRSSDPVLAGLRSE